MFGNDHAGIARMPAAIDLEDRMEVDINKPVENPALSLLLKEPAAAEDCARAELRKKTHGIAAKDTFAGGCAFQRRNKKTELFSFL